jgi:hypothetical protein
MRCLTKLKDGLVLAISTYEGGDIGEDIFCILSYSDSVAFSSVSYQHMYRLRHLTFPPTFLYRPLYKPKYCTDVLTPLQYSCCLR